MSMRESLSLAVGLSVVANSCSTGETPWIKSIIDKYHETAKNNDAIVRLPCPFLADGHVLIPSRSFPLLGLRAHRPISSPGLLSRPSVKNSTPARGT